MSKGISKQEDLDAFDKFMAFMKQNPDVKEMILDAFDNAVKQTTTKEEKQDESEQF